MALIRRSLFDVRGRKHVQLTHDTVNHQVWVETFGPAGGHYGTVIMDENTAADAFRDIIASIMGITTRGPGMTAMHEERTLPWPK